MKNTAEIKSIPFNKIVVSSDPTIKTGVEKFDKWFSKAGGIVIGSAIYVSGTSGAGKTTLMVNLMKWLKNVKTSMYLREMEDRYVKQQTENIVFDHDNAFFVDVKKCPTFEDYMAELDVLKPKVVIIDSLQVIAKEDYDMKNIMGEDKACYHIIKTLRKWISENEATLILIGHNTKEGNFAGANTNIQMMDAHIDMVFDKKKNQRTMSWGQKNRKGPMGTLYYVFGENAIEFFSEEEWKFIKEKVNFQENFIIFAQSFKDSLNPKDEAHAKFLAEFNREKKALNKIGEQNNFDFCKAVFEVMMNLSAKNGI
jgi:DNA repair protein RadA/Sms